MNKDIAKAVLHLNRIVAYLFVSWTLRTNDMDTIECAAFRYDTVEVENGRRRKQFLCMTADA